MSEGLYIKVWTPMTSLFIASRACFPNCCTQRPENGGRDMTEGVASRRSGQYRQAHLLHEATLGDSLWIRQDSVVSAGTLCPELTVTGRVTQYPASKDGEAESALKLPLWSGHWSGNQTVRTKTVTHTHTKIKGTSQGQVDGKWDKENKWVGFWQREYY